MDADVRNEFDEIKVILNDHDAKFQRIDERFDKIEKRFDDQDERFHAAGLREEQRDDVIRAIYDIVISQAMDRERVTTVEEKLGDHNQRVKSLETIVRDEKNHP